MRAESCNDSDLNQRNKIHSLCILFNGLIISAMYREELYMPSRNLSKEKREKLIEKIHEQMIDNPIFKIPKLKR